MNVALNLEQSYHVFLLVFSIFKEHLLFLFSRVLV